MRAQHGVGHGVERNRQVQIGAVLAPQYRQALDPRSSAAPALPRRCHPPTHRLSDRGRSQPLLIRQFQFSPSSRGFSPPSTTLNFSQKMQRGYIANSGIDTSVLRGRPWGTLKAVSEFLYAIDLAKFQTLRRLGLCLTRRLKLWCGPVLVRPGDMRGSAWIFSCGRRPTTTICGRDIGLVH